MSNKVRVIEGRQVTNSGLSFIETISMTLSKQKI